MPLKIYEATIADFESVLEKFNSENSQHQAKFLLFLADIDPSTKQHWCRDCVRAVPVINERLSASTKDVALLIAYVGDRPTWKDPSHSHPWRVDPRFKLTGVPTLIRWENEAVAGRLEEHEADDADKIDALLDI